jgi:hypothetical protein
MYLFNIKKIVGIFSFGFIVVLGTGGIANAQNNNWGHDKDRQSIKQQQKIAKAQAKAEQERVRAEQARLRAEQLRQQRYNQTHDNVGNYGNNGYNNGTGYNNNNGRFRVMRGGRSYNTDSRGAELLRQAVNQGYQQGYAAGQNDRNRRRRSSYTTSSVYRSGNYGYQSYVDSSQYQYYFQQGFQRGYQDGYNSRNQYGSNNGGSVNILSAILGSILNIQSY